MKITIRILTLMLALILSFGLIACTADEPKDTTGADAGNKNPSESNELRTALDLTAEWNKVTDAQNSLAQGCIIIRKDFTDAHPAEVKAFLAEYKKSVEFISEDIDTASNLIAEAGILPKAAIAKAAIPNCNIVYVDGADMKAALSAFYNILYSVEPTSIGGAVPNDGLYYTAPETTATPDSTLKVNVTVLSGTTGMGMAKLMSEKKAGNAALDYNFTVVSDPTQIAAGIVGESIDIAAVPTNLASTLYKKTSGNVNVLALNTLGVLYVIEKGNTITDVASLKGKTVYVPGQGTNPEYILKYIIEKNGLKVGTDVKFDYTYGSPDELSNAVVAGLVDIALLPEPKVTAVKAQIKAAAAK